MKIKINQEDCIGCGSCVAICPDVFDINQENKAVVKNTNTDQGETDQECAKEAVEICPIQVIEIEE
ncbi:ferredoxin [Patescibacteria group bacterium]|nr:ferredoxin [Patescibacteria group bacterium]MBU1563774.1 ferredoxin [Patescibacteria group bacterium]MBU2068226.1 ferredoxin [Patescibacteria group bacterium]